MSQGIAPFDRLTKLTKIINADDLIARWIGLTEQQIADSIANGRPKAYEITEKRSASDGSTIYYCEIVSITPLIVLKNNTNKAYSYGNIIFSKDEVEDIERQCPDLTYQLDGPRGIPLTADEADGTALNQIPCYRLAKRWGCSDEDVLFIIKTGGFDFPCSDEDSESVDFVYDSIVFENELIEWEKSHKSVLDYLKSHFQRHLCHINTTQELKDTTTNKSRSTCAANDAHKENSLSNWKRDLAIAVKLTFRLAKSHTTTDDINFQEVWDDGLRSNNIEDTRQEAFNIFRKALREEMKEKS